MALSVSVQQAAANALASYLQTALGPDIDVHPRWPDIDMQLFAKASRLITITLIGRREDEAMLNISPVRRTDVSGQLSDFAWSIAACKQPMQLDVWTQSDVERDDVLARLDQALHAGTSSIGVSGGPPVSHSLLLALKAADGWGNSYADFVFGDPDLSNSKADESEFRATLKGDSFFNLTITAESARIAQINLRLRLKESDAAAADAYGTASALASEANDIYALK